MTPIGTATGPQGWTRTSGRKVDARNRKGDIVSYDEMPRQPETVERGRRKLVFHPSGWGESEIWEALREVMRPAFAMCPWCGAQIYYQGIGNGLRPYYQQSCGTCGALGPRASEPAYAALAWKARPAALTVEAVLLYELRSSYVTFRCSWGWVQRLTARWIARKTRRKWARWLLSQAKHNTAPPREAGANGGEHEKEIAG